MTPTRMIAITLAAALTTSTAMAASSSTGTSLNQRNHTCERRDSPRSKRASSRPHAW